MSINIKNVNGVIQINQGDGLPRCYYGGGGTSGKFYPNKINGAVTSTLGNPPIYSIVSNTTIDCTDDTYAGEEQASTSGSGSGGIFNIDIVDGSFSLVYAPYFAGWSSGKGYAVGDTVTFYGSDYGGEGVCVIRVDMLGFDGFLIEIGGDNYRVAWYDLIINNVTPTEYTNAVDLLRSLFDGTTMISL